MKLFGMFGMQPPKRRPAAAIPPKPKIIPKEDHRYLFRIIWSGQVGAWYVDEVSPSGNWFFFGGAWLTMDQFEVVDELPDNDGEDDDSEDVTPRNPIITVAA